MSDVGDGNAGTARRGNEGEGAGALRIGTRGSPLARWQAEWVAGRLREVHAGLRVEIVEIKTLGDRDRNSPLARIGGAGVFTKEIQRALMEGSVDVAVHSLKDLPTRGPSELTLGAVPEREEVSDALIAPRHGTLENLPTGARIGTGSTRRGAQLRWLRPDLEIVGIRGNVETRLKLALEGELDGVVLASAGLNRLGLGGHATERLGPPRFLPAVAQGALGIECRADDDRTREALSALTHGPTLAATRAERCLLAELEGGCLIPLGAWARVVSDSGSDSGECGRLELEAAVFDAEGRRRAWASGSGRADAPEEVASEVARALRAEGAEELLRGRG